MQRTRPLHETRQRNRQTIINSISGISNFNASSNGSIVIGKEEIIQGCGPHIGPQCKSPIDAYKLSMNPEALRNFPIEDVVLDLIDMEQFFLTLSNHLQYVGSKFRLVSFELATKFEHCIKEYFHQP